MENHNENMEPLPKPDPVQINAAIDELLKSDLSRLDITDIEQLLTPVFVGYAVVGRIYETGSEIFRARKMKKPGMDHELLYPQPQYVLSLGRCNRIGESVLYTSTSRECPFFEIDASPGDTIAIAKWHTTRQMKCNQVGFTPSAFNVLGSNRDCPDSLPVLDATLRDTNQRVAEFLAKIFTQSIGPSETSKYKVTVAVARKMFCGDLFDGLCYPSVAMWANGDNIALKSHFADTSLALKKIEFLTVKSIAEKRLEIEILDTAVSASPTGQIEWRGRYDQWLLKSQGDTLSFVSDGEKWIARDGDGHIVDPD